MAGIIKTYKPSDIALFISGFRLTGIESIQVKLNPATFKFVPGIRGKHARVKDRDTSADIIVTLLQTSTANDFMNSIFVEDFAHQTARLEVELRDFSGTTVVSSSEAYITSQASVTYDSDLSARVWNIKLMRTTANIGGNTNTLPKFLEDALNYLN